jgi:hypothetical protein
MREYIDGAIVQRMVPVMKNVMAMRCAPLRPMRSDSRPYIGVKQHRVRRYAVPSHEAWLEAWNADPIGVSKVATTVPSRADRKVHDQMAAQIRRKRHADRPARL